MHAYPQEDDMPARKPMMGPTPDREELSQLVEESLKEPMTDEQFEIQKASFAFGNAPDSEYITKDSVRNAINSFRIRKAA